MNHLDRRIHRKHETDFSQVMTFDPTATQDQLTHAVVGPAVDSRGEVTPDVSNDSKYLDSGSDGTPPDASNDSNYLDIALGGIGSNLPAVHSWGKTTSDAFSDKMNLDSASDGTPLDLSFDSIDLDTASGGSDQSPDDSTDRDRESPAASINSNEGRTRRVQDLWGQRLPRT